MKCSRRGGKSPPSISDLKVRNRESITHFDYISRFLLVEMVIKYAASRHWSFGIQAYFRWP